MTYTDRCRIAEQCLPEAPYRSCLTRLHCEMLTEIERLRSALELIAAPQRPDGTWNRDREECRRLACEALGEME